MCFEGFCWLWIFAVDRVSVRQNWHEAESGVPNIKALASAFLSGVCVEARLLRQASAGR